MDTKLEIRKTRMMLLLIAGIPIVLILAATWLWFFVARGDLDLVAVLGTANQGSLVQPPRDMKAESFKDAAGVALPYGELESKWTFLVPQIGARCGQGCENTLYTTRQIHVALGKGYNRIQRVLVADHSPDAIELALTYTTDERAMPDTFEKYIETEHRDVKVLTLPPGDVPALFSELENSPDTWYLVDPAGWIMMSYSADIHYKDVMADLKFLLKNSSE